MTLSWRRLLATVTVAAAMAVAPAATAAATAAGASSAAPAPTSGWNDFSCRPSAQHPRPVVLVHGTFANGTDNWLVLAPYLVARGYCVFSFDYGMLPGETLIGGLGPIADSAQQLSDFTDRVLAATHAAKVDIVGHSQGGMMPRYYLKFLGGAAKVNALVALAPDNHGTTLDGLTAILPYFPGAAAFLRADLPGLADQLAGSDFQQQLNAGGDTVPGVHYTVISTIYDEVVTPYTTQALSGPGVHNVVLQNLCPVDTSEHVAIGLTDRIAFHEAANALDPSHATPTTCLSAFS
ncbi:Lipase (class 2) [Streptomyces sp. DvalAA-14]|uniref:esterase/lipase family protein n=1 Tax=unclassified Streptomyces TaxID=2593676 RepID=UPI00081AFD9F|nr:MULTISPECIES: alpha/beta fold hydrolase [unclassified Streptomyces]MYS20532.1 alpha/beta fold hydrolase [Streptomyces sp. SID4948]SCD71157.1 Lipase (class 2) [Streptomyces sp. DvalAA-14]